MLRLQSNLIGIDSGDVVLFSDFEDDGEMWTGDGPRYKRVGVEFSEPFSAPPAVTTGFSMWDMSNDAFARVDIRVEDITTVGFTVVFQTWGDTKIARMRANWQAIGEIDTDDNWDI